MSDTNQKTNSIQNQIDAFDAPLTIPANKLDADHYSADDLDGVTESLFGSGNMAYASLQASQTDAALITNDSTYQVSDTVNDQSTLGSALDTDRSLGETIDTGSRSLGSDGNFSNTTLGSLGASTLSSDVGSFTPDSNLNINGDGFFKGNTSSSVSSGNSNSASSNPNIDNSNNSIQNDQNTTTQNIDNSVHNGDQITNINQSSDLLQEIVDTVNNEITEITETISTTVNNVTDTLNNILNETGITEVINDVTNIVNNTTDTLTETVSNILDETLGGGITIDLDTDILDTLGTDINLSLDDSIKGNISVDTLTDNLLATTHNLTGLNIPLVTDLRAEISFDLLSGETVDDGNDITIAGLNTPDIDLALVENIVGDIDISLELPEELLDLNNIVDTVQETIGTLSDLDLADSGDIFETLGDHGIEASLDAIIGDTELGQEIDVILDSITEDSTETIDEILTSTGNVLDELTGGATEDPTDIVEEVTDEVTDVFDTLLGSADDSTLGDTIDEVIADTSDVLGDITDGATEDLTDNVEEITDEVTDVIDSLLGNDSNNDENSLGDMLDILSGNGEETENENDDSSWTETVIGDGGLFDDIVDGLEGNNNTLPDPSGTVGEGLGILSLDSANDDAGILGGFGGLFG